MQLDWRPRCCLLGQRRLWPLIRKSGCYVTLCAKPVILVWLSKLEWLECTSWAIWKIDSMQNLFAIYQYFIMGTKKGWLIKPISSVHPRCLYDTDSSTILEGTQLSEKINLLAVNANDSGENVLHLSTCFSEMWRTCWLWWQLAIHYIGPSLHFWKGTSGQG